MYIYPFLIILIGIPIEKATDAATVEFLILCKPIRGTLIFLIKFPFDPGKLIFISNFE